MNQLQLYSIMPLDETHLDEICEDIKDQYTSGVMTCPLFKMTLVPEGNPPVNKAKIMSDTYALFRERLNSLGIPNGVLVQATIGHGWVLSHMFPYQRYTNLNDGAEKNTVCPYDEGFRTYVYDALRTIASHHPDHIMIDDDFRLLGREGAGCACPLHMKRFNELAGTDFTREEFLEQAFSETEGAAKYAQLFLETQRESLVDTAKIMRAGIDSIDPSIPGSFCCVGNNVENAPEIARILAGEGNPVVVRINNGNYTAAGPRFFSTVFFRAAAQAAKLKGVADVILAETDTCPQNRYSTSARFLHTHFTGSLLEGTNGAKQWITRLSSFEPESGKAYRKILGKYRGFYETLADITPTLKWRGLRMPVLGKPVSVLKKDYNLGNDQVNGWGRCVIERLGLPMFFSAHNEGVLCLEGDYDKNLTDAEIREALKGPVFLASDSAKRLIERGFGEYLGVDVQEWTGKQPSQECLYVNGNSTGIQQKIKELIPVSDRAEIDSMVYHTVDKVNFEELFPGTVIFQNSLGGIVFTFCGSPDTNYNLVEAFSFLNYSRKQQLIRMLSRTEELPVYYPGDEEVYFRAADMPDGNLFCGIFNIGFDPIEEVQLVCSSKIHRVKTLLADGSFSAVPFTRDGDLIILSASCEPVNPLVLILER